MITFEPMREEHIRGFVLQPEQSDVVVEEALEQPGELWSFLQDGKVLALGGAIPLTPGRAWVWALLAADAGPDMLALTRYLKIFIDELGYRRVEMYVSSAFRPGCRWASLLGFKNETPSPMPGFFPNGQAAYLYARVT